MKISTELGELQIEAKDGILHYSLRNGYMHLIKLSSAILTREDDEVVAYQPILEDNTNLEQYAGDFEDTLGKGKIFKYSTEFRSKDNSLWGDIELKLYDELFDAVEGGNYPYLGVQVVLDVDKSPKDLALYGYAPVYAFDNGFMNLRTRPLKVGPNPKNITFYSNGYQSWSHNHLSGYREQTPKVPGYLNFFRLLQKMNENQDRSLNDHYFSEMHAVITDTSSMNSLVIGFLTHKDQFNRVLMDRMKNNGRIKWLCALSQTDDIAIGELNEGLRKSEQAMLSLVSAPEAYEVLTTMQVMTGKLAGIKIDHQPIAGYCSWYYYYEDISEKEMISNLEFFENNPDIPIDLVQLDDGYQTKIGDWGVENDRFNQKFPLGLQWLSDRIKKGGFNSGLWVAPFNAIASSKLLKKHPEWMIHNKKGKMAEALDNWREMNYALDLSNPEVLEHMRRLGEKVSKDWGFDYLKIDFLFSATLLESKYHDPTLTRAQVLHQGIKAIREGLGQDKVLLGCGAPLGPSLGLVDAMRIGEDTAAEWAVYEKIVKAVSKLEYPALKPALRATIQRSYMHNTLWINDPDCVVVRQNRSKLNMDEILLQLTIFGISGGSILVSDDEPKVDQERMDLLKLLLPPYSPLPGDDEFVLPFGNPLDLFQKKLPELYARDVVTAFGRQHLVAVINWGGKKEARSYKIRELLSHREQIGYTNDQKFMVFDYWDKEGVVVGNLDTDVHLNVVAAHGCKYLIITPLRDDTPALVSSSFHIIPVAPEIASYTWENMEMELKLKKLAPRKGIWVWYSKQRRLRMDGMESRYKTFGEGFLHYLEFSHSGHETRTIKFLEDLT